MWPSLLHPEACTTDHSTRTVLSSMEELAALGPDFTERYETWYSNAALLDTQLMIPSRDDACYIDTTWERSWSLLIFHPEASMCKDNTEWYGNVCKESDDLCINLGMLMMWMPAGKRLYNHKCHPNAINLVGLAMLYRWIRSALRPGSGPKHPSSSCVYQTCKDSSRSRIAAKGCGHNDSCCTHLACCGVNVWCEVLVPSRNHCINMLIPRSAGILCCFMQHNQLVHTYFLPGRGLN